MRYVKVLLLVIVFFLGMIFLFQNQAPLSQKLTLELNLLVLPPMKSIELPFYMVVLLAFLVGSVMSVLLLLWDRMRLTARAMRANWRVNALEASERRLISQMEKLAATPVADRPAMFAKIKAEFLALKDSFSKKKSKATVEIAPAQKEGEAPASPDKQN